MRVSGGCAHPKQFLTAAALLPVLRAAHPATGFSAAAVGGRSHDREATKQLTVAKERARASNR
jgi:hypothetical protein